MSYFEIYCRSRKDNNRTGGRIRRNETFISFDLGSEIVLLAGRSCKFVFHVIIKKF